MVSGSFSAGCLEWPRAVSGCLAPAATFFHRPGDWVLHAGALRATSAKQVHADLRPNVECGDQSPLTNELTLRPSCDACQVEKEQLSRKNSAHAPGYGACPSVLLSLRSVFSDCADFSVWTCNKTSETCPSSSPLANHEKGELGRGQHSRRLRA